MIFLLSTALADPPPIDVEVHGLLQVRTGMITREDAPPLGFARLERARIMVNPVIGIFRGMLQLEIANGVSMIDARVDATLTPWLVVAAGQGIVPYSRSWNTPVPVVATGDRSHPNNLFSPGRRVGAYAQLHGGPVTAWVGAYDATPPADLAGDVHAPLGIARIQLSTSDALPHTEMPSLRSTDAGATVGAAFGAESAAGEPLLRATVDAAFHVGGFSAQAEAFTVAQPDVPARWGGSVQVGQFMVPQRFAVHGRLAAIGPDVVDENLRLVPEVAFTGYVYGSNAYLQLRARMGAPGGAQDTTEVMLRGQLAF